MNLPAYQISTVAPLIGLQPGTLITFNHRVNIHTAENEARSAFFFTCYVRKKSTKIFGFVGKSVN